MDSNQNLDTISASQASKEVTANALFDALSPSSIFGRRASTTTGLTWGYYGGKFRRSDGSISTVQNGTITLTNNATNYLYADSNGTVTKVTSAPVGWPGPLAESGSPAEVPVALYQIVTSGGVVTSYTDYRTQSFIGGSGNSSSSLPLGGTAGQVLTKNSSNHFDASWVSPPFDVNAFYPGGPSASAILLRVPLGRAVAFPANFAGSRGSGSAAATASTAFDIKKNGSSVGTMTFAGGATSATFTSSGGAAVSFAAGDVLSVHAPSSPDLTLADVGFALIGTR